MVREPLDDEQATSLARVFKAIGEPVRLLSLLASHTGGEACGGDLTGAFDLAGPTISHNLEVLRETGVIEGERRGTWRCSHVRPEALRSLSPAWHRPRRQRPTRDRNDAAACGRGGRARPRAACATPPEATPPTRRPRAARRGGPRDPWWNRPAGPGSPGRTRAVR
ncbi:transcriptional regulator [Saccharopolyspora rhizosphaerae]|uniref:Transcriptional regulator n=1 Tax=Saccharopolyspora rhizosphaerae TaxID=2492662 RepID=A0A426K5M1_9PSEU|nr:transcriptional regulator [Saccharopolyspora rhizosphaerae]